MSLRIVYRVVFVMFLAVMSLRVFAQTEVGVSLNSAESTSLPTSPYVGAGLAVVGGEFEPNPAFDEPSEPDADGFDLETETSARAEDDEESESLDINPMLFSAGSSSGFSDGVRRLCRRFGTR